MCPPFESFLGFCNFESCWVHSRVQDDLDCTQISNVRTFIKETIKENNESILLFTTLTTSRKTWFHSKITSPCKRVANLNIFTLICDVFSINFKPRFRYSNHLLWWFRFLLLTLNEDMKIKFRTGNGFFLFSTVITQESTPVFLCYLKISFSQYYHWNFYGLVNFELDTFNFVAIVHGKKLSSLLCAVTATHAVPENFGHAWSGKQPKRYNSFVKTDLTPYLPSCQSFGLYS